MSPAPASGPTPISGHEIRQMFLDYFKKQKHKIRPSASLVPEDDPTLLFTGAGMNQFKDYFLGLRKDMKCAASCQKCFRTPDLENVGKTASHLTFFEMLGNFSFGDYFKKEAIAWAWEFSTVTLKLPPEKLWVTVYKEDDEAYGIWKNEIKIPESRIVKLGAKDNFWPSNAPTDGPNGPCGPCSEIYFDYGTSLPGKKCTVAGCGPACSCGRFVEYWNLVFTQFDRQSDGSLKPLPAKNIDTGMGLERLTAIVNGVRTNFDTDLLKPIVDATLKETGAKAVSPDIYAIADHVRGLTFLISDGVIPSNEGRGYVARMLLRKAVRHGRGMGTTKPFLYQLVPTVVKAMSSGYPELVSQRERVAKVILIEEEKYFQNLEEKSPILDAELKKGLTPEKAAWLYDTHGLPYEEIAEAAQSVSVAMPPRTEFNKALEVLQAKSKKASGFSGEVFAETLTGQIASLNVSTQFVGYEGPLSIQSKVVGLLQEGKPVDSVKAPAQAMVLLDKTPFYGESGGQMGDTGTIEGKGFKLSVSDTKRIDQFIVHVAKITEGTLKLHDSVTTHVDSARREQLARNHTATHLLHAALRKILGPHVHQAGSLVAPDRLRFDFTHSESVSAARISDLEMQVNEWVCKDHSVGTKEMGMKEATAAGALAFFGDKYGDRVRVVTIDEFSKELCGGTHLHTTGQVGVFTVADEGSVASGVRRIEALTGQAALKHLKGSQDQLEELASLLKAPRERLVEAIERLKSDTKALQSELERLKLKDSQAQASNLVAAAKKIDGVQVLISEVAGADMAQLRQLADALKKQIQGAGVVCLGSVRESSAYLVVATSPDLVQRGVTSQVLISKAAPLIGGKGGGRPEFAQAGGADTARLKEALNQVQTSISELLKK